MLSRLLGMVRDMVWLVVPQASLEAFLVAFKLPNMLRDLVGEGAMNAAFVPVFSETLEKESEEGFKQAVASAMTWMLILLAVMTALGVIFVPQLLQGVNLLSGVTGGPPKTAEEIELLRTLARWVFPYLFFICMAVFAMGALFTVKHYTTPSWSPALLNVSIIVACLLLHKHFEEPAYALVAGVWLGGIAQALVMYIALGRHAGVWRPSLRLNHPVIPVVVTLMGPVILGQAAGEVNKLVDALFAISRGPGTVTALYYANRLTQLPLSVFGFATAAAVLPLASQAAAQGDMGKLRETMMQGLRQTFFLVTPALLGLVVLGRPTVRLLFERWAHFGPDDTLRTTVALAIYAVGLWSFAGVKVAVSGFYAMKKTGTPVIISSLSMILNIFLNVLFVERLGYKGLALATTISYTVNFSLLYMVLSKRIGALWNGAFLKDMALIVLAGLTMAATAYGACRGIGSLTPDGSLLGQLACVVIPVGTGAAVYAGACRILRIPELDTFLSLLRRTRSA